LDDFDDFRFLSDSFGNLYKGGNMPTLINPYHYATTTSTITMGPQSQQNNGSIKKCRKAASTYRKKQRKPKEYMVSGHAIVFDRLKHCRRCQKYEKYKSAEITKREWESYKHGHHDSCEFRKKKTKENQETTMDNFTARVKQARCIARKEALENDGRLVGDVQVTVQNFVPMGASATKTDRLPTTPSTDRVKKVDFVYDLIEYVEKRIEECKKGEHKWIKQSAAPTEVALTIDYILPQFEHRRESSVDAVLPTTPSFLAAASNYYQLFPEGTATLKLPKDMSPDPSPIYHPLEGQELMYLDWNLCSPGTKLPCPHCVPGLLKHEPYTNFSKHKGQVCRILKPDASSIYCVLKKYRCNSCERLVDANDAGLLANLPAHVREIYPVPPRYCNGRTHLHKDLIDIVESLMLTYGNADFIAKHMVSQLGKKYENQVATYLSKGKGPTSSYPKEKDWMQKRFPPSGETLRLAYFEAESSKLQPYGYSNKERYNRELQSVNIENDDIVAYDHTFQVLKNYSLKGAKALFTGMTGKTKEVVSAFIVPTTKLYDVSHGLTSSKLNRKNYKASTVYTDTCPHGIPFWKGLFGASVVCLLGLFHFLQRMVKTLDYKSELFWDCLVELQEAIYEYNADDLAALTNALKDGSLNGKQHSDDEIKMLRKGKAWHDNYETYLRKRFHTEDEIKTRLACWVEAWTDARDPNGRLVMSNKTAAATNEQMTKVKYVLDSERATAYTKIAPSKAAKHQLTSWRSNRPESNLEQFHGLLAHYANNGMRADYADTLNLRGIAKYNQQQRQKFVNNKSKMIQAHDNDDNERTCPAWMEKHLLHTDHSLLHYLNQQALAKGIDQPFEYVETPTTNNGEVFLSEYFTAQVQRNYEMLDNSQQPSGMKTCQCIKCTIEDTAMVAVEFSVNEEEIQEQEEQHREIDNDNDNDFNDDNNNNNNPLPSLVHLPAPSLIHLPAPTATANQQRLDQQGNEKLMCFPLPPFQCSAFRSYVLRKMRAQNCGDPSVLGRPPHKFWCPKSCPARAYM
jgi:hypothetical protein